MTLPFVQCQNQHWIIKPTADHPHNTCFISTEVININLTLTSGASIEKKKVLVSIHIIKTGRFYFQHCDSTLGPVGGGPLAMIRINSLKGTSFFPILLLSRSS